MTYMVLISVFLKQPWYTGLETIKYIEGDNNINHDIKKENTGKELKGLERT